MQWFLTLNDEELEISSVDQLQAILDRARQQRFAEVWLQQVHGRRRGFDAFIQGILGLGKELGGDSIGILLNRDTAILTFLDGARDEFVGLPTASKALTAAKVEFELDDGERVEYPARECVTAEEACRAVVHFFERGERPSEFRWRKSV